MPRHLHSFPTRRSSDLLGDSRDPSPSIWALARFPFGELPPALLRELEVAKKCLVVEEHVAAGGAGEALAAAMLGTLHTPVRFRSEEHTSELQSLRHLVCPDICTLSLHDALPICSAIRATRRHPFGLSQGSRSGSCRRPSCGSSKSRRSASWWRNTSPPVARARPLPRRCSARCTLPSASDRKSTRLNSSHLGISYAPTSALFPYTTLFRSARRFARPVAIHLGSRKVPVRGAAAGPLAGARSREEVPRGGGTRRRRWRGRGPCRGDARHVAHSRPLQIGRAHV